MGYCGPLLSLPILPSTWKGGFLRRVLPGLLLALACAVAARLIHGALPAKAGALVGEVVVAVLLGLVIGNLVSLPSALAPGIRFSFHTLLRVAIVILGAQFSFMQVVAIGGKAVVMIVVLMTLALAVAHALGRVARVPGRLATLIGVGTAVCGNTAITATAPVIHAEDEEVSFAIATNTLFGTAAVFVYPMLGHLLGMSSAAFGTWAGTAVNDTSQVVATGFAYGDAAGKVATAVKLTRNALMGPVIVVIGLIYARGAHAAGGEARRGLGARLGQVALSGVGLSTRLSAMRRIGATPFLVGLATAATTAIASYFLILWLGPAGG
ncbi:MAG: putative sulfate exporter family transporter [Candidatus Eisenbacteria bacterium]|uniref:Putative sulfate exporter family transporter n=1 Tax=Eiseniibacteriota bacterium TaxID=2212470 RepID=A0A538S6H9_UNCEI|nr:MAG: putative sulfate exporter family transporter [Candidatus Eisenbacteria bacterium]